MEERAVPLCRDPAKDRRLVLEMIDGLPYAFVESGALAGPPMELQREGLYWVLQGLTYQTTSAGGHFMMRLDENVVRIEFRGVEDLTISRCAVPVEEFRKLAAPALETSAKRAKLL